MAKVELSPLIQSMSGSIAKRRRPDGTVVNYVVTKKYYRVVEKAGTNSAIDYDDRVYDIEVTLTDNGAGRINAVADPEEDTYDFTNEYDAEGSRIFEGIADKNKFRIRYTY